MQSELLDVENMLGEIGYENDKIEAILSVLNDSLDELIKVNKKDSEGARTHYEVSRVAERDSMLLFMVIELVKGLKERNAIAAKSIGEIRRGTV